MKSPREILLTKHQPMEPRLHDIRRRVLESEMRELSSCVTPRSLLADFWREVFWRYGRAWSGLAAAWVVICAMQLSSSGEPGPVRKASAPLLQQTFSAWHQRQEVLSKLREDDIARPAAVRPRSERVAPSGAVRA